MQGRGEGRGRCTHKADVGSPGPEGKGNQRPFPHTHTPPPTPILTRTHTHTHTRQHAGCTPYLAPHGGLPQAHGAIRGCGRNQLAVGTKVDVMNLGLRPARPMHVCSGIGIGIGIGSGSGSSSGASSLGGDNDGDERTGGTDCTASAGGCTDDGGAVTGGGTHRVAQKPVGAQLGPEVPHHDAVVIPARRQLSHGWREAHAGNLVGVAPKGAAV
jgi:hypothetical protein